MRPTLLTPKQVAEVLQVKERTVIVYLQRGELAGIKVGNLWRIAEGDLDAFIQSRKRKGGDHA
jgi:excisionase family DNA binding protein